MQRVETPPEWLWPEEAIKDTPSIRAGMKEEEESISRCESVRIITEVGQQLKLKHNPTLATASLLLQRFYMIHSFQEFPKEYTSLGCLFLAGKIEETPKKCKDVCVAAAKIFPKTYTDMRTLVDKIMGMERLLLCCSKFDLKLEHPYKFLSIYIRRHELERDMSTRYIQTAWTFVNDSLHTTLGLLWEPEVIAVAMLYLSFQMDAKNQNAYKPKEEWWNEDIGNLPPKTLDKICHQVLDFYSLTNKPDFKWNIH